MKNNISAITTGAHALGSIIGPMIASVLTEYTTYRWGCLITSLIVVVFCIIQSYAIYIYKDKEGDLITYKQVDGEIQLIEDSRSMNWSFNES